MELLDGLALFLSRKRRRRYSLDYYDTSSSSDESEFDDLFGGSCTYRSDTEQSSSLGLLMKDQSSSNSPPNDESMEPKQVSSLLDIAAAVTAEHCSCEQLESNELPLDETVLKKIAFWAFPQDISQVKIFARLSLKSEEEWRRGESIVQEGRIQEMRQVGFMVSAIILKKGSSLLSSKEESKVSLTFERQKITSSTCATCPGSIWCQHIIATIIYRIQNAEKIPCHAPVTEVLSTLTRDQLQKILQYAINEDPGGVLGRVFQHIDEARDTSSKMNTLQGAPDPTFGVGGGEKSNWEVSLELMKSNLLDELRGGYRFGSYPDTCNINDKCKSGFYQHYFQRVGELIAKSQITSAGKVLINIALAALEVMEGLRSQSGSVRRIFHDIERMFSSFVIAFEGPIIEEMITTALDINDRSNKLRLPQGYLVPSQWADITSIKLHESCGSTSLDKCNTSAVLYGGKPTAPFFEPILVSQLPDPPESLSKLFGEEKNILKSDYDEPVSLMLLRFDTLHKWPHLYSTSKVCKLGIIVLKKLLKLSLKFSIIKVTGSSVSEETKDDGGPSTSGPSKAKRSRRTKSKSSRKSKESMIEKSALITDEKQEGLSGAQVYYSLLHVCYMLYQTKKLFTLDSLEVHIILNATFRSFEMSRFRSAAPNDTVSYKDCNWLLFLEGKIQEELSILPCDDIVQNVADMYASTLMKYGLGFYHDCIPIALINLLVQAGRLEKPIRLELCVQAVCYSTMPLTSITSPNSEHIHGYERADQYKNKESIIKKWSGLVETVFISSSNDDAIYLNRDIITKILKHLEKVEDGEFLSAIYDVIRVYQSKLSEKQHKLLLIKIILRSVKQCVTGFGWGNFSKCTSTTWETLIVLGQQLEMEFPKLVLPFWQELCKFYTSTQLKALIEIMKCAITNEAAVPSDLVQMLSRYFEAEFRHDEECCELLKLFDPTDKYHHQMLKKVTTNFTSYTPAALLLMAKNEHEQVGVCKSKEEIFTKDVFKLIQLSYERIRSLNSDISSRFSYRDSSACSYLKWFFDIISQNGTKAVIKGAQFDLFVNGLAECMKGDADMLVAFFKAVENNVVLFEHTKLLLGKKLIMSYQTHFDRELRNCNHTSYHRILSDMCRSKHLCSQYVENGSEEFVAVVIEKVRKWHKGKKKLLKLMDDFFVELKI